MRKTHIMLAAAVPAVAAGAMLLSPSPATHPSVAGKAVSAATVPPPLVVVFMENHGLGQVIKDPGDMPYLNKLWADPAARQLTDYFAVAHPSFPNYAALATGSTTTTTDIITAGEFPGQTVWGQLSKAGDSWGVYEESMPAACSPVTYANDTKSGADGPYKIGHNPAVPFSEIYGTPATCQNVQPLSSMPSVMLPDVSFVAPNLCDDMHGVASTSPYAVIYKNCVTGTDALEQRADSWLASHVPGWVSAGADVLVTFDEGSGNGNQVYAVLTGPGVTGGADDLVYSHYSLLAGIEDAYGLPLLGNAATAKPVILPSVTAPPQPSSACPSPPSGQSELSGNVSVEGTQAGWTGTYNGQSSVTLTQPPGGSYDGTWALKITPSGTATGTAGVSNANPAWVTATVAGKAYTGNVLVRASTAGEQVTLLVREVTPSGTGEGYHTTTITAGSGWQQLTSVLTAKLSGDLLRYSVYAANLASGQSFQADCLSIWN